MRTSIKEYKYFKEIELKNKITEVKKTNSKELIADWLIQNNA